MIKRSMTTGMITGLLLLCGLFLVLEPQVGQRQFYVMPAMPTRQRCCPGAKVEGSKVVIVLSDIKMT